MVNIFALGLSCAVFALSVIIARDAFWRWWDARKTPVVSEAAIFEAVRTACVDVGLAKASITDDFDLAKTGKLYEVLHHAARRLGRDHELRTIGDVCDWLSQAPANGQGHT